MGVLSCDKNYCGNIMCDRYSEEFGYLCYECFNDLLDLQKIKPDLSLSDIKEWMDKPKQYSKNIQNVVDLEEVFKLK